MAAGVFLLLFAHGGEILAQTSSVATPSGQAPAENGSPATPSDPQTNVPSDPRQVITPPKLPDVLDGLESLQLVKDPDWGPPIIEAQDLFQGRLGAGAGGNRGASAAYMAPLEANLSTPDLSPPSLQTGVEAAPLAAPVETSPMLPIPDTFGPTMGGLPLDALAYPGSSMLNRPLGTIGAPSLLSAKHSFPLGNNRVRFGVSVNAAAAYNNNVSGSASNPQGDMIFTLQPTLYLETGKKGTIQFMWSPSLVEYLKYKKNSSVNQSFAFSSRYRWTKLRVGLDASYIAQSGLFLNSQTQGQSQQKALYAKMFAGYSLTKKTEVSLNFAGGVTDTGSGGRQFQGTLTAAIDYRYSRKTTIGAAIALGYSSFPGGMSTSESFLLRLLYNPTSKLVFKGEGGLQFRRSSSSTGGSYSAATTVMNASLTYHPSSKTYVSLQFFRNVDMNTFSAGTQQITTGVQSTVSWQIARHATFDAGLAAGRIENIATNGQDAGTYNYVQATMALSYALKNDVNISLFDSLQQRLGDAQGANYLSNTSGMSLGMGF